MRKTIRPSFASKVGILFIAIAILGYFAHSGFFSEHWQTNQLAETDTLPPAFSDDELFFFQDTLTSLLLRQQFNGAVLLAHNGTVIFNRSFGFADFRNHTPLTPDTPFQLASISKTFTAAAVLLLQEEGKLHIDDAAQKHIPEFPYPEITIRMLLTHTSGLQNYMWLVEHFWRQPVKPTNEDVLQLFLRHPRPLDFRPGTRFAYSNTGYAFLGLLIERVSGQSYASFMEQHIFAPLEMNNTFAYDLHGHQPPRTDRAYGFRRWGRGHIIIPDVDHDGILGDKGIYSNIGDLYLWDRAISQGLLLSEAVWEQVFEYTRLSNDRPVRYGMGWRLQTYMGKQVVHHPGRWNGFRTSFKRFVEDDATLIVLSNNNRDVTRLVNSLQGILFYLDVDDHLADQGQ